MKFWRYSQVKAFMEAFKRRGFFQIRFPGGTSWNGEINAVVIVAVFDPNRKLYFLVIPYDPKSFLKNMEITKNEPPKILAIRKLKQETGLKAESSDLVLLWKDIVDDNRLNQKNKKHTKYFYLLEKFSGTLLDLENSSFLNKETATPFLIPSPLLAKELFGRHLEAYKIAVNKLLCKMTNEDIYATKLALEDREKKVHRLYEKNKKRIR